MYLHMHALAIKNLSSWPKNLLGKQDIKAQVKDLCYISSNQYLNCIIRDMLMKGTDHPPGIADGVSEWH